MPTPAPEPPRRRTFNSGLLISLVFHVVVISLLAWFAAREGMLGQPLKQITVSLMPPPVPEKPPVAETPKPELPEEKTIPQSVSAPPKVFAPAPEKNAMPVPEPLPAVAAPAPAERPSLAFDDGSKMVQTEKDPAALYRSFVEFSLRSRWNRPTGVADANYVAEIEIAMDATGRISNSRWKRKSGDARWDASVMDAVAQTKTLDRPPPAGFPARLTVRFDVVQSAELNIP
jgi:TonB family protein